MQNNSGTPEESLARAEMLYRFVALFSDYEHINRDYGSGHSMSMSEIHMLVYIHEYPGVTASEMAEHFLITPSAVSQMLSTLENREYIVRMSRNGKKKMVFCTQKGKHLCDAHRAFDILTLEKVYNYLRRDCEPEEIQAFYKVINVYNNIMLAGRRKRLRAVNAAGQEPTGGT